MQQQQDDRLRASVRPYSILVTGARGFIGSRLVSHLTERGIKVKAMSRRLVSSDDAGGVRYVKADAFNADELARALRDVDIAYYLLHSMEGDKGSWEDFADREETQARNFVKAAASAGVKRIIYLGGLADDSGHLSRHMQSRRRVGMILAGSSIPVTELRASIIIGAEGSSYAMLRYLVERLPVMVCPRWVKSLAQPISVDDVVTYLARCAEHPETAGRIFEIGGPDVLSYEELMRTYAGYLGKTIRIIQIPALTTRLSSYWVDLVTPVSASLARPLVESLVHNTTVTDDEITRIIPLKLQSVTDAIAAATKEMAQKSPVTRARDEKTGYPANQRILMAALPVLALIGTSYYWLDARPDAYHAGWLLGSAVWFAAVVAAIRFVHVRTRLGYLVAGILSWATLGFWLLDSLYPAFGAPTAWEESGLGVTARNFVGVATAAVCAAASHNAFHKIRRYQHRGVPIPSRS